MATHAIRLLTEQHRDVEKWFEQLAGLRNLGVAGNWPHEGWPVRGTTDSGEEIRESSRGGLRAVGPLDVHTHDAKNPGIPRHSEVARTATPLPTEGDGRTDDAVPGQEFRDMAGHHADGKTHVGLDDERVRAQMIDAATGRMRPEGMIGQGRENLAGVRNQFDAPTVDLGPVHAKQPPQPTQPGRYEDRPPQDTTPATVPQPDVALKGASPRNPDLSRRQDGQGAGMTDAPQAHAQSQDQGGLRTAGGGAQVAGGSAAQNVGAAQSSSGPSTAPTPVDEAYAGSTEHDLDHKRALAARLFDALIAHSVLEEQLLYPQARLVATDLVEGSLEAHREMREVMDDLRHADPAHPRFDHLIDQLHRQVQQHVRDEEQDLFPRLQEKLGTAKLEELGALMQERARVLIGLERRFSVAGTEGVAVIQPPAVQPGHMDEIEGTPDRKRQD